ncbi:pentapeptide repeat-containing protein [Oscillospiraceae bacterium 42-9]
METSYFEGECFENLSFVEESWQGLRFVDCQFQGCSFERCRLSHCSFSECRFSGCKILEPVCDQSEVRFLELDHCELTNVNWSLLLPMNGFGEPIDKVENCQLKYNFFTEVPLRKFSFLGSALTGSLFADCDLTESNFSGCPLEGTEFFRCDLRKADFRGASGYKIDALTNKLKGALFRYPEVTSMLASLGIVIE